MPPLSICFNYTEASYDFAGLKFPRLDASSNVFGYCLTLVLPKQNSPGYSLLIFFLIFPFFFFLRVSKLKTRDAWSSVNFDWLSVSFINTCPFFSTKIVHRRSIIIEKNSTSFSNEKRRDQNRPSVKMLWWWILSLAVNVYSCRGCFLVILFLSL